MRYEPTGQLPAVTGQLGYIASGVQRAEVRIFPPTSGIATERPKSVPHAMPIHDARPIADSLRLDEHGFEFHARPSEVTDFYDDATVREHYYPEVRNVVRELMNAEEVFVFDHNVRRAVRAARGELGVRVPVDQVHNDYTLESGPKRKLEILAAVGRSDLSDAQVAFVNLWRPILGPVRDNPLAVCDARTVAQADLVVTDIHHFGEDNATRPRHSGQIYSVHHNAGHRWFYISEMQPAEFLLLKCYDSRTDGRARFMPHTGFGNPACPTDFIPRESIEVRTLVVFNRFGS